MATSPRVLAGSVLHAEALRSAQSYTSHWDELQNPAGDMPYGEAAPPEASFTREQLGHFTREGYVVLRGFYSLQELEALRSSTHEVLARLGRERQGEQCSADMFCEEEFNPVKDTCSHHRSLAANAELSDGQCASLCADGDVAFAPVSGPSDVSNPHRVGYVNDIHLHHRALAPTEAHPKLLNCLRELLGPDIDAWQVATVVKSPGLRWWGGGYSWHQDIADYGGSGDTNGQTTTYEYHGMTNFGNVCAITYLNDCAPDRGATSVIPRSHRSSDGGELIRRPLFTSGATEGLWNGPYRTIEGIDELEPTAVTPTVAAGDVLLFDSWIIHRANINTDEHESKIGLINVYCRPDCLPAAGPRADGSGTLGLALMRGGQLVHPDEESIMIAGGEEAAARRGCASNCELLLTGIRCGGPKDFTPLMCVV